jgi:hypothetical protein
MKPVREDWRWFNQAVELWAQYSLRVVAPPPGPVPAPPLPPVPPVGPPGPQGQPSQGPWPGPGQVPAVSPPQPRWQRALLGVLGLAVVLLLIAAVVPDKSPYGWGGGGGSVGGSTQHQHENKVATDYVIFHTVNVDNGEVQTGWKYHNSN